MDNLTTRTLPPRTGEIKKIHIKDKLKDLGLVFEDLILGDFDNIGEFTAKKSRNPDHPLYSAAGAFFRPNYERGILIYQLIRHYEIDSFLEIGFGRGYGTFCAAMAMAHKGSGKVVTIDPNLNKDFLEQLSRVFPADWFQRIEFRQGTSQDVLPNLDEDFDFIYIDGNAGSGQEKGETIFNWYCKLKPGGIYSGHDYYKKYPLTIENVNKFAERYEKQLNFTTERKFNSWWVVK